MTDIRPATSIRWRPLLLCAAATVATFAKTLWFPFVNWEDPSRILDPAGSGTFGFSALWRTLTDLQAVPYQPITDLSYRLIAAVWGAEPSAFHAVNVALHTLSAILLYRFLLLWGIDHVPAVAGSLLFALHPLRAEAVAWASGQAEILATLFVLASGIAFLRYRSSSGRLWYRASLIAAIAGLGSSITATPWPIILFLLDHARQRQAPTRRLAEFVPFFAAGLAVVALPVARWISNVAESGLPVSWTTDIASSPSIALLFFFWQTVAPSRLAAVYEAPALGLWWWIVLPALATAIIIALRASRDRMAYRLGMLWSLFFLLPAGTGLIEAPGPITDRATMLAAVGVSLIGASFAESAMRRQGGRFARLVKVSAVLLLAVLGTLAGIQSETWSSSLALWTRATDRSPTSALAHNYLGAALAQEKGDLVRAEQSFTIALHHDPALAAAYANRGATRAALGREEEALQDLDEALRLERNDAPTRMLRASILRRSGRREESLRDMHLALALHPMNIAWMVERVELLLEMGRTGEAAAEMEVLRRAGYDVNVGLK
jgi:tetratricopeptide (TPR) repeat protein